MENPSCYDEKSELWLFGMILLSLWTLKQPFADCKAEEKELDVHLLEDHIMFPRILDTLIPHDCPIPYAHIIRLCCAHSPSDRPLNGFVVVRDLLCYIVADLTGYAPAEWSPASEGD